MIWTLGGLRDTSLTFHEGCVGAAVVVKVSAVRVVQAVVSQAVCVAETLQDTVHETLQDKTSHTQFDSLTDEKAPFIGERHEELCLHLQFTVVL